MLSFKSTSYEEMRLEYFREQRDSAERRMNYWCRPKQADRVGWMEASDRASEAGAQYNFYKDALEALENNSFQYETGFVKGFEAAQPKWISVEEQKPKSGKFVLFQYAKNAQNPTLHARNTMAVGRYEYGMFLVEGCSVKVTHWMPLPEPPKEVC